MIAAPNSAFRYINVAKSARSCLLRVWKFSSENFHHRTHAFVGFFFYAMKNAAYLLARGKTLSNAPRPSLSLVAFLRPSTSPLT